MKTLTVEAFRAGAQPSTPVRLRGGIAVLLVSLPAARVRAQEIRATQEGGNLVRVIASGRFETTFSKRKGFGATWVDLKHDPAKKRDRAPVLDGNGRDSARRQVSRNENPRRTNILT